MSVIFSRSEAKRLAELALIASPHNALRRIRISELDDALVLSGTVNSFYLKQIAQGTVRSVIGETELVNAIVVI